jgi:hypothetical protein
MIELNDELTCVNSKPLSGNDIAPKVIEGDKYIAKELHTCGCGKLHIGVGLPMECNWVKCYDCSEELPSTTHWCHPSRFTK